MRSRRLARIVPMGDGAKQYVHGATHLILRSGFYLFAFLSQTRKIERAMDGMEGLVAYEFKTNGLQLRFETCGVWPNRRASGQFMDLPHHVCATRFFHEWATIDSRTVTWSSESGALDWEEAHRRLGEGSTARVES